MPRISLAFTLAAVSLSACNCAGETKVGDSCDVTAGDGRCTDGSECVATPDCEEPPCGTCGGPGALCESEDQCDGVADDGIECVEAGGEGKKCEPPVELDGRVFDALDVAVGIADADVIALDINGAAISQVATSGDDGAYALRIPGIARDANGVPVAGTLVTLRAGARDYLAFPSGIRQAIPIDLSQAEAGDGGQPFTLANAATDIALVQLDQSGATVAGTVEGDGDVGGVLIVAVGDGTGTATALSDSDGAFRVFNVADGDVTVSGYAGGAAFEPATVTVASDDVDGVVITKKGSAPTGVVTGSVQIVNGNGNNTTSVVLAVADTFDPTIARGEVPRGLRASNVTGGFTITGVGDGEYVVLAAFENDGLVRDPDVNIGGTELVHVTVSNGNQVAAGDGFKVTGALDVVSPGADGLETVSTAPDFVFADDSSEDSYEIVLFDALGNVTHQVTLDSVSGSDDVTYVYDGPALEAGMIYQYRATSVKQGSALASTEDLKGTFLFLP